MTRPQVRVFAPTWLQSGVLGVTVFDPIPRVQDNTEGCAWAWKKGVG